MKRLIRNLKFLIFNFFKIFLVLRKRPIRKIRIFKFKNWHHGYCYFTAKWNDGTKIFVKVDTKVKILKNEIVCYNELKKESNINLVKVFDYFENKSLQMIFQEFMDSDELSEEIILKNPEILKDVFSFILQLNKQGIVHRDIKLDNFILVNDKLYMIDFAFAYKINNSNIDLKELAITEDNLIILKGLGRRMEGDDLIWNDFYSMREDLKEILHKNSSNLSTDYIKQIKSYVSKFDANIEGNSYIVNI
jgi:tRNA A-37 threonylcarbamoyl transferase component Bud32